MTEQIPHLELVQLLTAGAEAWIGRLPDGVALSDGRGAHGGATAEWVVSVLLAVYRHLDRFVRAQDRGEWDYHQTEELAGKKILIVGAGDVGQKTRARLEPFEVETAMVGRTARDGVHGWDELPALLPRYDATVLIVPLTDETRGMVDADFLAAMPGGALLVNGARGPVVDTDALLAELTSGRIRAAVDVTDPEPLPPGHPLWSAPGLLLTPHVGGPCRWRCAGPTASRPSSWRRSSGARNPEPGDRGVLRGTTPAPEGRVGGCGKGRSQNPVKTPESGW